MQDSQEVLISPFTDDCYDCVFSLWQSCEGIGLSEADSRERIVQFLRRNPGTNFVAIVNGEIVGTVLGGHDGRRGYLHHLAVLPAFRRRGIAHMLIHAALDALRAQGIDKCHGFVFRKNSEGINFWRAAGWTVREDICLISRNLRPPEQR